MANKIVCIFAGGFHILTPGHVSVYRYLQEQFPEADIYLAATNDTSSRPLTFKEKQFLATQAGIPANRFVQVKRPYVATEILSRYNLDTTTAIYALSAKDADRFPPTKKDGTPSYLLPWKSGNLDTVSNHAYIYVAPVTTYKIQGHIVDSASVIRNTYSEADDRTKLQIIKQLYPASDKPMVIKDILDRALPKKIREARVTNCYLPSRAEQDTAISYITDYLKMVGGIMTAPKGFEHTQYSFVLAHGRPFYINENTFKMKRGTAKQCFNNAAMLAVSSPSLTYVEGYCHIGLMPIDHAWCVDKQGNVIETTMDSGKESCSVRPTGYFGVPFNTDYVRKVMLKKKTSGIIQYDNRDIFKTKGDAGVQKIVESPNFDYSHYENRESEFADIEFKSLTRKYGGKEYGFNITARLYGEPLGGIDCAGPDKEVSRITLLWMLPDWQGTGLGQTLYDKAIKLSRQQGFKIFRSDERNMTPEAHRAWERLSKRYKVNPIHLKNKTYYEIPLSTVPLTEAPDFGYSHFNDRDEDIKRNVRFIADTDRLEDVIFYYITARYYTNNHEYEEAGKIFFRMNTSTKEAQISAVNLSPEWRGTGLGQLLYDKAINTAKQNGCTIFKSDTMLSDLAHKAWRKLSKRYKVQTKLSDYGLPKGYEVKLTESPDFGYSHFNDRDKELSKDVTFIYRELKIAGTPWLQIVAYLKNAAYLPPIKIGVIECKRMQGVMEVGWVKIYDTSWSGTGLGQMLYDKAIEIAKMEGYAFFRSDITRTPLAKKAWAKLAQRYDVHKGYDSAGNQYFEIDLQKASEHIIESSPVKFNKQLNPKFWDGTELKPEVEKKLLEIASTFIDELSFPNMKVLDITLSGSNASYNYTEHSDLDLHIIVQVPEDRYDMYQTYFNVEKTLFNEHHDITLYGQPVEVYVQMKDEVHISNGVYSLEQNTWLEKPQHQPLKAEMSQVEQKAKYFAFAIARVIQTKNEKLADRIWNQIKEYRKTGLKEDGELGTENLVFKLLRNSKLLDSLVTFRKSCVDARLSL